MQVLVSDATGVGARSDAEDMQGAYIVWMWQEAHSVPSERGSIVTAGYCRLSTARAAPVIGSRVGSS
jgi:hypothetical protein